MSSASIERGPWIDVSIPLHNGMVHWPGDPPFELRRISDMSRGDPANLSELRTTAHVGTHLDAPVHFLPDGAGIDATPLDALIGPARVVEIRDPHAVRVDELRALAPQPGQRLLFKTANSQRRWDDAPFREDFVYIDPQAAELLARARVRTVGIDYLSVGGFRSDGAATHRTLLEAGVTIIEGLDLRAVTPGDYELLCLPLRIVGADGAPARALLRPL